MNSQVIPLPKTPAPPDVEAIAARALAAPGGTWEAFTDHLHIPWSASTDDEPSGTWDAGRYLAVQEHYWHTGSEDPPPELWAFLAAARTDVLALVAEVRRLRAALAAPARKEAA